MKFKLYTQNNCVYCEMMKKKLDGWGIEYEIINIFDDPEGKSFLKEGGYKTVPQLFFDSHNVNSGINTPDITYEDIYLRIMERVTF